MRRESRGEWDAQEGAGTGEGGCENDTFSQKMREEREAKPRKVGEEGVGRAEG